MGENGENIVAAIVCYRILLSNKDPWISPPFAYD